MSLQFGSLFIGMVLGLAISAFFFSKALDRMRREYTGLREAYLATWKGKGIIRFKNGNEAHIEIHGRNN